MEPDSVSITKVTEPISVGGTVSLKHTVLPANADDKTVTWKSLNEGIAKVDGTGKVTAISPGKATIEVTTKVGNKKATTEVTVEDSLTGE